MSESPESHAANVATICKDILATPYGDIIQQDGVKQMLSDLDVHLEGVQEFARKTSGLLGSIPSITVKRGPGRPPGSRTGARKTTTRRPRRGGRPGSFGSTNFILDCVRDAGRGGIKAGEIVRKVQEAAPGHHAKPSALVSTILTRLKKRGQVRRRTGKWYPTGE